MALFPLGILSAAGAGGAVGDYELIQTQILGTAQSSITFDVSSFASTYKHLQVRATTKSQHAAVWDFSYLRLNADTAANYSQHSLEATYQPTLILRSTGAANSSEISFSAAGGTNTSVFGVFVLDILDAFSTSKNKTARIMAGYHQGASSELSFKSGAWRNNNAITSITLGTVFGTNYIAGSRFSIYGVRG